MTGNSHKYVYRFGSGTAEGNKEMKALLGGKGANLAEMSAIGLPVPPGFTITTETCRHYVEHDGQWPEGLEQQVHDGVRHIEEALESRLGDPDNPLLVSVRSGAALSMPGMMDTVLNLGLNDRVVEGLAHKTGNVRFAYDAYRRFIDMFGNVVMGVSHDLFEEALHSCKTARGVENDVDLSADDLRELVDRYKAIYRKRTGYMFPADPHEQLRYAINAVFGSWNSARAVKYRQINRITGLLGTAVNVQAMVFGNMGQSSGTGVCFTRNPSTGAHELYGEFLINAQGEDVVAGIRTPEPIAQMARELPQAYRELVAMTDRLEKHYQNMQDIEFTVQEGRLFILQTRNGKRTGTAAVKIAVDMVSRGLVDKERAVRELVEPGHLDQLLHPGFKSETDYKDQVIGTGLPASPGAAVGQVVFSADDAEAWKKQGRQVILVRVETSPEDVGGMDAAEGILTSRGGMTCVAGETQILTDRGLLTAEQAFGLFEKGADLRILSFCSRTLRPVWRSIIAAGRKPSEVIPVRVSQTGRAAHNTLRLTADHKMYVLENRHLVKKRLDAVLADDDFLTVVDRVPALNETATSPALAYVAGAIFSDGYINLKKAKGSVTFTQKATPEKAAFIAAVEASFEEAFGVPFSYVRERTTEATLRGRLIKGQVEDRICYRREPAARLAAIRKRLSTWVLSLDRPALLSFLAGFVDGDGAYSERSSAVRIQIVVARKKRKLLQGLAVACLRLGIVPQITNNRENYVLQIAEHVQEILTFSQRFHASVPARLYESKCLAVGGLFEDIVEEVNYQGRVREGIRRNLMFGVEKLRRDVLPLCPDEAYGAVESLLEAPLRSYRVCQTGAPEPALVYNFEVDATDELDKNFVVFSSRLTPVLVSNSHAAVVARGWGKPCVAGCGDIVINYRTQSFTNGHVTVKEGDWVSINGSTGEVILGQQELVDARLGEDFDTFMAWADAFRTMGVRTNADTPQDAEKALSFGAEGIGLCRTEHMFFEGDRIEKIREMILASDERTRRAALAKLLPFQKEDFRGIFRAMAGKPVTIRLLDPPLHEFLPHDAEGQQEMAEAQGVSVEEIKAKVALLDEFNPMLGHRGCRLGITYPEITEMQARAILEAAVELAQEGVAVHPEIMVPLVGTVEEFVHQKKVIQATARKVFEEKGEQVAYLIGTMIEIPRAVLVADDIAREAEFFSFGTNDLTQMTFGYSRDDAGTFLPFYAERKILEHDPFQVLDRRGVGQLVRLGTERGRSTQPDLKVGICGEHGGEPLSVAFCYEVGLDYVSCSPFRVPIARLAAAQAHLRAEQAKKREAAQAPTEA